MQLRNRWTDPQDMNIFIKNKNKNQGFIHLAKCKLSKLGLFDPHHFVRFSLPVARNVLFIAEALYMFTIPEMIQTPRWQVNETWCLLGFQHQMFIIKNRLYTSCGADPVLENTDMFNFTHLRHDHQSAWIKYRVFICFSHMPISTQTYSNFWWIFKFKNFKEQTSCFVGFFLLFWQTVDIEHPWQHIYKVLM